MRQGMRPRAAAEDAVRRILQHYPDYVGALVTVNARCASARGPMM